MDLLNRLYRRKETQRALNYESSESQIEQKVGHYLLNLPRCSSTVIVAGPAYPGSSYNCEVSIRANDLLPWAEHHAGAVFSMSNDLQAARLALPIWLRCADRSVGSATQAPLFMHKVLEPYVIDFYYNGITTIYCFECRAVVPEIHIETRDEKREGKWIWWTMVCSCPMGHQLYYKDHNLHYR